MASERTPLLSQWLDLELTNGNDGRGSRWFRSDAMRRDIELQLRALHLTREPFEFPVVIELTRVLGKRQSFWDADSKFRGNSKELIDAMVACGWLHDDGPKFVTEAICHQDETQRKKGPATIIEIFAAK
jgi:hypothetical protein